jgi:peptidoglycan/xylan/chitin deacetylase (PgdA/CDA1 family)
VRDLGWDIVSLDEASRRIECGEGKRFVCFTFDDGYKDTLEIALPIFKRHGALLCVYVTTGLVERTTFLWWPVLENLLLARESVRYISEGQEQKIRTVRIEQKRAAYALLFPIIKTNSQAISFFELNEVDAKSTLDRFILTWADVQKLAAEPLVEIGCHTVTHPALATLSAEEARRELEESRRVLEEKTGRRVSHVSYPFGTEKECGAREFQIAAEMGFRTGTTTRRGRIVPEHKNHLTALPRINVPGSDSASLRFIRKCLFGDSLRLNYATPLVTD